MTRQRGFANPDWMIMLVVVGILTAIIVPRAYQAWRRVKDAALIADVNRVQAAEDAYRAAHKVWADTLDVRMSTLTRVEQFRTDSTGWSVVLVADSGKAAGRHCAMFDGADLFRPSGQVGQPRELACW